MENTKKMILIEPEVIERLKTNNNDNASTNNLSRLDEEMHKAMKSKLDDREKWALYLQTLQRYLHFIGVDRKPIQIPILELNEKEKEKEIKETVKSEQVLDDKDTSIETNNSIYTKSHLLSLIPKSYKSKGELIIDILLKNKDKIFWNQNGTVFINNKEVYKSNIVDLLGDILRPLKNSSPSGWTDFALLLKDLTVPLSYIGNPRRATFIKVLSQSPTYDKKIKEISMEEKASTSTYSTPKLPSKTSSDYKVKPKKLDWERWTPY